MTAHAVEHSSKGTVAPVQSTNMENVDEETNGFFQFVPPPDNRFDPEVEQQWVRNTVVDHFPRIKFP